MMDAPRVQARDDFLETDEIEDKDQWNKVKKFKKQVIGDQIEAFGTQIKVQGNVDPQEDSLESLLADAAIPDLVAKRHEIESFLP